MGIRFLICNEIDLKIAKCRELETGSKNVLKFFLTAWLCCNVLSAWAACSVKPLLLHSGLYGRICTVGSQVSCGAPEACRNAITGASILVIDLRDHRLVYSCRIDQNKRGSWKRSNAKIFTCGRGAQ